MSRLIVNANNVAGSDQVQIRYRPYGSEQTYTEITIAASQLPYAIENIASGRYEVGVRKKCGGTWSDWTVSFSAACADPIQFTVSRSGSNFVVIYKLPSTQEKFEIEIIDPNNGKTIKSFDGTVGTETFAIAPFLDGVFSFRLRGICDDTVSPVYASEWTDPVTVTVDSGCTAPIISSSASTSTTATTSTHALIYTNYTTNIRIQAIDQGTGSVFMNVTEAADGSRDVVLLKGKTYAVTIFNQCANSQELGTSVTIIVAA